MCAGIATCLRELPEALIGAHHLQERITARGDGLEKEVRFLFRDRRAELPIWLDNELMVVEWGNRDNKPSRLPRTGWCRLESLEAGKWRHLHPLKVVIPANYGLEKGVWFQVTEGMEGIVVRDDGGSPHVYMITTAASHYYGVMTRHDRMPVLVGQTI